mgnify:CR=1 FL=1
MKYRKPFKGNGVSDTTLIPLNEYNLTSYYGCYKNSAADQEDGVDPDAAFNNDVGCKGRWQANSDQVIIYTNYVNDKEVSKSAYANSKDLLLGEVES